jgi:Universal stress protein UspA and related nucleotide-binding proteins
MIKKILVAYDDGSQSKKALETAIEIAGHTGAEIYVVAAYALPIVYQGTVALDGMYPDNTAVINYLQENSHAYLEKILKEAAGRVREANIPVHIEVLDGSPGRVISQYAEEKGVDLVTVGSHNRTMVNRFFIGSVSNYILQHVKCLVLIAKD